MINKIVVESFKSLEKLELELGVLNVFVGANGSGKSNLLEAVGVLSAAAGGRVDDPSLLQRGVRPGTPRLFKSAFPSSSSKNIYFRAETDSASYGVALSNSGDGPSPVWRFQSEVLEANKVSLVNYGRGRSRKGDKDLGLAALDVAQRDEGNPASRLIAMLRDYVIFTPSTNVLRGVSPETQPRQPLGLSGGRLPSAVAEWMGHTKERMRPGGSIRFAHSILQDVFGLIGWARGFGTVPASAIDLSPAAASSAEVIRFNDRFMRREQDAISGYDASEGALYVLFLACLAFLPSAPSFFAVDNADHGLNPALAKAVFQKFSKWLLASPRERQVLVTTHNPAVLDGLPIQDDRIRLFTVDRDNGGRSIVRRVELTPKLTKLAGEGWTLSRLWTNKLIGGMPDV